MTAHGVGRILAAVFGVLLVSMAPQNAKAEEVKVGAGAAPTENVFKKIQEPMEKSIGLKLVLTPNGPVAALKDLDEGKVEAAAGGLTFPDWMAMMEKEGYKIPDRNAYKFRVIGKDIVNVFIHKDIPTKQLSKDQLKGIFAGTITNWKELGGPDLSIKVVNGTQIPGTQAVFQKQVMDDAPYTTNVIEATTAPDVKQKVISTPGAVGLGPASLADASVGVPAIPEVGRPITLITKGAPSASVQKMLEFISGEGQKYLTK